MAIVVLVGSFELSVFDFSNSFDRSPLLSENSLVHVFVVEDWEI